ncbi:hypothetical protein T492DRAFT_928351 [Pavlovales sp. CCMP2436]|nr:hypothetical protein T492DRAFT_928351 [Pavlovales sp. CCMP2436]
MKLARAERLTLEQYSMTVEFEPFNRFNGAPWRTARRKIGARNGRPRVPASCSRLEAEERGRMRPPARPRSGGLGGARACSSQPRAGGAVVRREAAAVQRLAAARLALIGGLPLLGSVGAEEAHAHRQDDQLVDDAEYAQDERHLPAARDLKERIEREVLQRAVLEEPEHVDQHGEREEHAERADRRR